MKVLDTITSLKIQAWTLCLDALQVEKYPLVSPETPTGVSFI